MRHLTVASIGPVAADLLEQARDVEVFAHFERSFYLLVRDGLVCVGEASIGDGPINVVLAPGTRLAGLPVTLEMKGVVRPREVVLDDIAVVSMAGAVGWQPPAWPTWQRQKVREGVARLRAIAQRTLPGDGLAHLVLAPDERPTTPEARAARPLLAALREGLPALIAERQPASDTSRASTLLLGLGPGTTPSGDDLLGGLMLALTARGATAGRDALWTAIAPEVSVLTTEISAMHLAVAADGLAAAALHTLGILLLEGAPVREDLERTLAAVAAIGHTSGWDALAGFVIGLESGG